MRIIRKYAGVIHVSSIGPIMYDDIRNKEVSQQSKINPKQHN